MQLQQVLTAAASAAAAIQSNPGTHTQPSSAAAAAAGASLVVRSLCRRRVTLRVCVYVYVLPPRPPRHRATLTVFVLPGIFVVGILRCDCKY